MNPFLEEKVNELRNAQDFQCWYLVKHSVAIDQLCYLVAFLTEYQNNGGTGNLEAYIKSRVRETNQNRGLTLSDNYRTLRVAAFLGLIKLDGQGYMRASITDTYNEIVSKCNGNFESTNLYNDVIQRQIEKMYISSEIDEERDRVRSNFRLFPIILLYKILVEIGKATGSYKISTNEYRYFVATTEKYCDFLNTLMLINLLRKEPSVNSQLELFRTKFDNRMIQAIKLLDTLEVSDSEVKIKDGCIKLVQKKVFDFENNLENFEINDYISFLGSTTQLFNLVSNARIAVNESGRKKGGNNILLYGVPGSGKSHAIKTDFCNNPEFMERVVFHPDYTYSDFVGQILPDSDGESIKYPFKSGPFTKILKKAIDNESNHYYLIIEEINRGNAPAIFGEIFQLLDRKDSGESEYGITNADIAREVYGEDRKDQLVYLPSNLFILATMNTSDQNVFTLDTAFQRRWKMRQIENNIELARHKDDRILDSNITWKIFNTKMNELIINNNMNLGSSEDKRLGAFFVKEKEFLFDPKQDDVGATESVRRNAKFQNAQFAEKVIKYLWDDAFKFDRAVAFKTTYRTLEEVIKDFNTESGDERFSVFVEGLFN